MLNKSHETKLSAFGLDVTINRWNRVYYSYPNAIMLALRQGNPSVFGESDKTERATKATAVASAAIGMATNPNTHTAFQSSQAEKAFLDEAAERILSQTTIRSQVPSVETQPNVPMQQAELIHHAQQGVEDARNWVPGQPVPSTSMSHPMAQTASTMNDQAHSNPLPLTAAQEEQQRLINYAQQGVEEAHDWLANQSTTTLGS